jgi:hypothetical protein
VGIDYNKIIEVNTAAIWKVHSKNYGAVTYCVGKRESFITLNPEDSLKSEAEIRYILKHESVHIRQNFLLGCKKIRQMVKTPEGQAIIEGEALAETGAKGEMLVSMLKLYPKSGTLSSDSLRLLVKNWYW